ncbi:MAG: YebC/PmpR family DNA-binding transcriptional regulator [Chthoniobacterales bacterium]
MSGHSKWSKIKRSKGALDVRRGKLFSKLAKEISVAVRLGGEDPGFNPRLRGAIHAARSQNMPNDNIDRAIKRGSSEEGSAALEEIVYEGYGPQGVAMIVETATDNKNRTAADIRLLFTKNNGNLAASGSVSYMFHRKGRVAVPAQAVLEDRLLEIILDAGGEELTTEDDHFIILTPPDKLYAIVEAIRSADIPVEAQTLIFLPQTSVTLSDPGVATQVLRLHDALEDCDDVLNVYSNFDIPEEILSRVEHH